MFLSLKVISGILYMAILYTRISNKVCKISNKLSYLEQKVWSKISSHTSIFFYHSSCIVFSDLKIFSTYTPHKMICNVKSENSFYNCFIKEIEKTIYFNFHSELLSEPDTSINSCYKLLRITLGTFLILSHISLVTISFIGILSLSCI